MDGLKRTNPFLDEDFHKEVTQRVLTNPTDYAVKKMEEEHKTDALTCTLIHIGSF